MAAEPEPTGRARDDAAPEVSVIIPCLNEEQNVPSVVARVRDLLAAADVSAEILIVDDCSDDYTFREAYLLAERWDDVIALHKGLPRGIGNAVRFAIERARGQVGVVVMGDGVDPLAAIPDMRDAIIDAGHDLVLLSRYLDPSDSASIPLTYRVYQAAYRRLLAFACDLPYKDATYAFRGFRLDFVRGLGLMSGGFEISPEMTLKTWTRGGSITELQGRQGRRIAGESKFLFSEQAVGYARVAFQAYRDARRSGRHRTRNWGALVRGRGA
ncbi:MAG TPA: glycosyltransferase family 2 protein [Solirubrobacter sp.]|nr:glycosyltransferase family 2 protein [Solirubrobacter sp.]